MLIKSRIDGLSGWLFEENVPDAYVPNYHLAEQDIMVDENTIF